LWVVCGMWWVEEISESVEKLEISHEEAKTMCTCSLYLFTAYYPPLATHDKPEQGGEP